MQLMGKRIARIPRVNPLLKVKSSKTALQRSRLTRPPPIKSRRHPKEHLTNPKCYINPKDMNLMEMVKAENIRDLTISKEGIIIREKVATIRTTTVGHIMGPVEDIKEGKINTPILNCSLL